MHKICLSNIDNSFHLSKPTCSDENSLDSKATLVFTDFRKTLPRMLEGEVGIDEAKNLMIKEHVKLKIVINKDEKMVGALSLKDINGEKALVAVKELGGRENIQVSDIMTPMSELKAISWEELDASTIRDVVSALQNEHVQHIFVADYNTKNIIGILSASDIARKLCLPLVIDEGPTFNSIYSAT